MNITGGDGGGSFPLLTLHQEKKKKIILKSLQCYYCDLLNYALEMEGY